MLAEWVLECQRRRVLINYDIIRNNKGEALVNKYNLPNSPKFSPGWFQKFLKRHDFRTIKLHGEGDSVDQQAVSKFLPTIQVEIAKY